MNRSTALLASRPIITGIAAVQALNPVEAFQNETLRPILKFQNELLIRLFRAYAKSRKGGFFAKNREEQAAFIEQSLQKDQQWRQLLLGSIIGHFTVEELDFYEENRRAVNKRCIGMLVWRLQSQLGLV